MLTEAAEANKKVQLLEEQEKALRAQASSHSTRQGRIGYTFTHQREYWVQIYSPEGVLGTYLHTKRENWTLATSNFDYMAIKFVGLPHLFI